MATINYSLSGDAIRRLYSSQNQQFATGRKTSPRIVAGEALKADLSAQAATGVQRASIASSERISEANQAIQRQALSEDRRRYDQERNDAMRSDLFQTGFFAGSRDADRIFGGGVSGGAQEAVAGVDQGATTGAQAVTRESLPTPVADYQSMQQEAMGAAPQQAGFSLERAAIGSATSLAKGAVLGGLRSAAAGQGFGLGATGGMMGAGAGLVVGGLLGAGVGYAMDALFGGDDALETGVQSSYSFPGIGNVSVIGPTSGYDLSAGAMSDASTSYSDPTSAAAESAMRDQGYWDSSSTSDISSTAGGGK